MSNIKDIKNIVDANDEMITYFNALYSEHLSELQSSKSRLFEINVKLDELIKTKSIYSLNSDYRKNLFSPINVEANENEKEAEIRREIKTLTDERNLLEDKIDQENQNIKAIETRLNKLGKAKQSVADIKKTLGLTDESDIPSSEEPVIKKASEKNKDSQKKHGKNILMMSTFDKTYISTVLDKRIKSEISSNNHKLEVVREIIRTDPNRAKVTVDEVIINSKNMLLIIDDCLKKNNYYFDDKKNIKNVIEDYLIDFEEKHPDIEVNYDLNDLNIQPPYIRLLSLYRIFDMVFENIYKHSKADKVDVKVSDNSGKIEVIIQDNGIGLPDKYDEKSSWYSGLKRIKELVYLLDGEVMLTSDNGTKFQLTMDTN
jgi:Signal transduction histidine kinase